MANIQIDITTEGKTTLATAGKYCDRNIDVNVSVPGGIGIVPDYWKSYLDTKATEINSALSAAGENKSAFLWYTDAHWTTNYGESPMLLKYLSKHTGMRKTFFGGDVANEKSGEIDILNEWKELVKNVPNHRSVIGNHDNQVTELPTAENRANFFIWANSTEDMASGTDATNGKMYYYVDSYVEKTRYICLSTGRMWTYADEVQWCVDVLNSTPNGWHIVVVSHLWLNNDYDNGGIITTPENYTKVYLDLFDAYNYRESGTTQMHGVLYGFANAKAKVEFVIGSHLHQDYDFTTAKGIPVILTECDAWEERDDASKATAGTTTENCVYAVVANYGTKSVNVINVGRGDTRSIKIPDVVTYTNWAKKAIDTSGAIYNNGMGYKENVRVNSSFQDAAATGWDATGYIPVRTGNVIRFKNCSVYDMTGANGSTSRCHIKFFDASFEFVVESATYKPSSQFPAVWSPVHDSNGDVIQLTVPTGYTSTIRYMRITMDDINENSIITVNEEIG